MRSFLRGSLLGLLTLGAAPLFAQPLEFRPAPATGGAAQSGVSLGVPVARTSAAASTPSPLDFQAATSPTWPTFRAKAQADQVAPEGGLRIEPLRLMPGKNGEEPLAPLPTVPTFVPPQPTMIAPAPGPVVGHPVPGPIMGQPVPGSIVSGPVVPGPHAMDSSPLGGPIFGGCGDSCGVGDCGACGGCGFCDTCGIGSFCGCDFPLLGCLFRCPDECGCCMYRPHAWIRGEYLYQDVSDPEIPVLLIANGPPANPNFNATNSQQLFGPGNLNYNNYSGGRISAGFWFPRHNCWGLDASFYWLAERNGSYSNTALSTGGIATGRPVIDALDGSNQAQKVAFPGELSGRFDVNYYTNLRTFDVNLRHKWLCGPRYFLDWTVGYRYLNLEDGIAMQETLVPAVQPAVTLSLMDAFDTKNTFNGGQLGLDGEVRLYNRWFLAGNFKLAMGNMNQSVTISGVSSQTGGAFPGVFPGGLYSSPTNIGQYSINRFCVIPEVGLKIGVDVTQRLRLFAGYNFLYVSSVMRAGEQIDQVVNVRRLPFFNRNPQLPIIGPNRPAVLLKQTDFIAHGLTAGLEYRW